MKYAQNCPSIVLLPYSMVVFFLFAFIFLCSFRFAYQNGFPIPSKLPCHVYGNYSQRLHNFFSIAFVRWCMYRLCLVAFVCKVAVFVKKKQMAGKKHLCQPGFVNIYRFSDSAYPRLVIAHQRNNVRQSTEYNKQKDICMYSVTVDEQTNAFFVLICGGLKRFGFLKPMNGFCFFFPHPITHSHPTFHAMRIIYFDMMAQA